MINVPMAPDKAASLADAARAAYAAAVDYAENRASYGEARAACMAVLDARRHMENAEAVAATAQQAVAPRP